MSKPTVLSTKILTTAQRELLLNAGISYVAHDFITIEELPVQNITYRQNLIFTSQNAVQFFLKQNPQNSREHQVFCVGSKTANALKEAGFKIMQTTDNASNLAQIIAEDYKNNSYTFVCGTSRRNELPDLLTEYNVSFEEVALYKTSSDPLTIARRFDGLLFFSPSGVKSYLQENNIGDQICFCIGRTTAQEIPAVRKHIYIATQPSVESTIVQVAKILGDLQVKKTG